MAVRSDSTRSFLCTRIIHSNSTINFLSCISQKWEGKLKQKLGLTNAKAILGNEQADGFVLCRERIKRHLNSSDYQWIRPEMWKNVFGGRNANSNKRVVA